MRTTVTERRRADYVMKQHIVIGYALVVATLAMVCASATGMLTDPYGEYGGYGELCLFFGLPVLVAGMFWWLVRAVFLVNE